MSNVTVQEALKSAIEAIDGEVDHDFMLTALYKCKAALSEIEKCEPVAMIRVNEFGEYGLYLKSDYKHLPIGEHDLFTSPRPREWVGLTDDELKETFNSADYKAMVTIDDVFFIAARAIEAKLKHLNTKG